MHRIFNVFSTPAPLSTFKRLVRPFIFPSIHPPSRRRKLLQCFLSSFRELDLTEEVMLGEKRGVSLRQPRGGGSSGGRRGGVGGTNWTLGPSPHKFPVDLCAGTEPSVPVQTWTVRVWAGSSAREDQRPGLFSTHQLGLLDC